jgi:sigma-B regulation protein RsbU (phosphoserine phosphatase)
VAEASYVNGSGRLAPDQVILIGTDGIWESRSPTGEPFGKHRVRQVIREAVRSTAQDILDTLLAELTAFQAGQPVEDDITAVVVKGVD